MNKQVESLKSDLERGASLLIFFRDELEAAGLWWERADSPETLVKLAKWIMENKDSLWEEAEKHTLQLEWDKLMDWAATILYLSEERVKQGVPSFLDSLFDSWDWNISQYRESLTGNENDILAEYEAIGHTAGGDTYSVKISYIKDMDGRIKDFSLQISLINQ